jgi:polar amino acid transport system substrate-binding protein
MGDKRGVMCMLAWCLCLFSLVSTAVPANEVVTLAIGEYAPYTSAKDKYGKLAEEIVRKAFQLESIDVEYRYAPWRRNYAQVRSGQLDGTFPWSNAGGREEDFCVHKIPLLRNQKVYFHLKTTPFNWLTIEDLKRYNVGVSLGYNDQQVYKVQGIDADAAASGPLNFKKMFAGRIDVYSASKVVGYYTIKSLFDESDAHKFTHHPKVIDETDYFILFSKKSPRGQAFCKAFDSGLRKLKDSGVYDEILALH